MPSDTGDRGEIVMVDGSLSSAFSNPVDSIVVVVDIFVGSVQVVFTLRSRFFFLI